MIIAQLELMKPEQLGHTHIRIDKRDFVVSTVKLPFMHRGGLFETMVFAADTEGVVTSWSDLLCRREVSADVALLTHGEVCQEFEAPDKGCGCKQAGILVANKWEIQKCDECALFETDDDAANATTALLQLLHRVYASLPNSATVADAYEVMRERCERE
jgi:hypothetical protein